MQFDQRIDKKAVLGHVVARSGRKKHALRLAKRAEIEADETISGLVDNAKKGRFLVVRDPRRCCPPTAGSGSRSKRGPRRRKGRAPRMSRSRSGSSTYGPMQVERHECGYRGDCPPYTPWVIEFSNPVDTERFDKSMVARGAGAAADADRGLRHGDVHHRKGQGPHEVHGHAVAGHPRHLRPGAREERGPSTSG